MPVILCIDTWAVCKLKILDKMSVILCIDTWAVCKLKILDKMSVILCITHLLMTAIWPKNLVKLFSRVILHNFTGAIFRKFQRKFAFLVYTYSWISHLMAQERSRDDVGLRNFLRIVLRNVNNQVLIFRSISTL